MSAILWGIAPKSILTTPKECFTLPYLCESIGDMLTFSRQYSFSAAHRLWQSQWPDEKNNQIFSDCARVHGHNYTLTVTLSGSLNTEIGGIYDLEKLDALIHQLILNKVNHRRLDTDVDFLLGQVITVEALAQTFYNRLAPEITDPNYPETKLYALKVAESSDLWAEAIVERN